MREAQFWTKGLVPDWEQLYIIIIQMNTGKIGIIRCILLRHCCGSLMNLKKAIWKTSHSMILETPAAIKPKVTVSFEHRKACMTHYKWF